MDIEEIKKELLELNFNVDSLGIVYWIDSIRIIKENPLIWDMIDIYEKIAIKRKSTPTRVERCMRHAIKNAKENIKNKYGYYGKIKNQTYLDLIRFKIL